jgi:hypothetical protein
MLPLDQMETLLSELIGFDRLAKTLSSRTL